MIYQFKNKMTRDQWTMPYYYYFNLVYITTTMTPESYFVELTRPNHQVPNPLRVGGRFSPSV